MKGPSKLFDLAKHVLDDGDRGRKTALVTGSVALGAVLTGSLFRRLRHLKLQDSLHVAPALDAPTDSFEIMEGRTNFYHRPGTGTPIVLLHSFNAAASSFEMKPIFDTLKHQTTRPLYALDWFGFGRSARPPVRYGPSIFLRQLRRFLSEHVHQPVDLVALSLGCEYAAQTARTLPYLVRRLLLVSPTGLSSERSSSAWQRTAVSIADSVGAFEIAFYRLTRPQVLRRFYERQVFREGPVPDELVEYASLTTQARGAHHAPRYFVQGSLFTGRAAFDAYTTLQIPTLILVPVRSDDLIQRFDRLDELVHANPDHIETRKLPGGLMPHWESPEAFTAVATSYLMTD